MTTSPAPGRRWDSAPVSKIYRDEIGEPYAMIGSTRVYRGGWYDAPRWQTGKEVAAHLKRWVMRSYETGVKDDPSDPEWVRYQCGGCRWFLALDGDYGLCANAASVNDGRLTFEHGGCSVHSELEKTDVSTKA